MVSQFEEGWHVMTVPDSGPFGKATVQVNGGPVYVGAGLCVWGWGVPTHPPLC